MTNIGYVPKEFLIKFKGSLQEKTAFQSAYGFLLLNMLPLFVPLFPSKIFPELPLTV